MIKFIKKIIENPGIFNEDEKYNMLLSATDKQVSPEELAEIVKYIKSKQKLKINLPESIEICGTGGSGLPRINTSTLACIKLAKSGYKVVKNGNKASSGRFGSFDLLESLGYDTSVNLENILKDYEQKNIALLFAKEMYPFLGEFANVRKRYGKPTIFNIIGPLLNPANASYQIIGCSFEDKMELMIKACRILGRKNVLVIRGDDGLDELSLSDKTKVYELKNGEITDYYLSPKDFGYKKCKLDEIMSEKIEDKIEIAKKIIAGEKVGKYSDLVDINFELALKIMKK